MMLIFICWKAFTYKISENFIKRFRSWQFSSFLSKNTKKAKKGQNKKSGFELNSYSLRSIYIQNFRKFHQTVLILTILFIFGQQIPKWLEKAKIENMASRWILNRWEASTYKILENFIKQFGFWQFYSFFAKQYQKG